MRITQHEVLCSWKNSELSIRNRVAAVQHLGEGWNRGRMTIVSSGSDSVVVGVPGMRVAC